MKQFSNAAACALVLISLASVGCPPSPQSGNTRNAPEGTACATIVGACMDELARQPSKVICFRDASRWQSGDLTWRITRFNANLDQQGQIDAVERALDTWASASNLSFTRVDSGTADIRLEFVEGSHGDEFPFDGPGSNLGHAFFPGSGRPGEIHLCGAEPWSLAATGNTERDVFTVALHEIGHALGLEHSLDENAVMAPNYRNVVTQLTEADVEAIQLLYGAPGEGFPADIQQSQAFAEFCADAEPGNLLDLNDPDTDGDGIPDSVEIFLLNTDAVQGDSDDDNVTDLTEVFVDRTDPNDDDDFNPDSVVIDDGPETPGIDTVDMRLLFNGTEVARFSATDSESFIFSGSNEQFNDIEQVAGDDAMDTDEYVLTFIQFIGTDPNASDTVVRQIAIFFPNRSAVPNGSILIRDANAYIQAGITGTGDSTFASIFCNCDCPTFEFFCNPDLIPENITGLSGSMDLRLSGGRVIGTFDFTLPSLTSEDPNNPDLVRVEGSLNVPDGFVRGTEFVPTP